MTEALIREAFWQSTRAFIEAPIGSYTDWHPVFGIL